VGVSPLVGLGQMDLQCLEDTGSSNFTLFEGDMHALGIDGTNGFWMPPATIHIAGGGTIVLSTLIFRLQA
jgi:hypothetical protein